MGKGGNEMTDTQKTPGQIAYEAFNTDLWVCKEDRWEAAAEAVRAPLLERISTLEIVLQATKEHLERTEQTNQLLLRSMATAPKPL
jgi:hypothetical protein